jgi:hypothetical protein
VAEERAERRPAGAADQPAERVLGATPGLRSRVRANRAFLARAVRYLAAEAGIRRFLDIGTGDTGREQHARGRPGGGAGRADRLRGQRPLQVGLCARLRLPHRTNGPDRRTATGV